MGGLPDTASLALILKASEMRRRLTRRKQLTNLLHARHFPLPHLPSHAPHLRHTLNHSHFTHGEGPCHHHSGSQRQVCTETQVSRQQKPDCFHRHLFSVPSCPPVFFSRRPPGTLLSLLTAACWPLPFLKSSSSKTGATRTRRSNAIH